MTMIKFLWSKYKNWLQSNLEYSGVYLVILALSLLFGWVAGSLYEVNGYMLWKFAEYVFGLISNGSVFILLSMFYIEFVDKFIPWVSRIINKTKADYQKYKDSNNG